MTSEITSSNQNPAHESNRAPEQASSQSHSQTTLRELEKGMTAIVTGFAEGDIDLETRLREIGFAEGDTVEALHWGLFGRNPMTVRLNGAMIAMRKNEAHSVLVEVQ